MASSADLEKEGLTLASDDSPRSRRDSYVGCPHWSHALGFTLLGVALSSAILALVLTSHQAREKAESLLKEADGEGAMQRVAAPAVFEMAPETTPPPAVCDDCAAAWDEAKVDDTCLGTGPAEARRLLEELDAEPDNEEEGEEEEDERVVGRRLKGHPDDPMKISRYPVPNGGYFTYFGSQDLNKPRINAKTLVIFVHGFRRNAQDYFCSLKHLIETSHLVREETLMITPKFSFPDDPHTRSDDCFWNGTRPMGNWPTGGVTDPRSPCKMSSFDIFDYLVHVAGDKEKFPLLNDVKILGFSAGGQTVHRYTVVSALAPRGTPEQAAAMKAVHDHLDVHYIMGNPGSYAYLDNNRWIYDCGSDVPDGCTEPSYATYTPELGRQGWNRYHGFRDLRAKSDATPFICSDPAFNEWGYGIDWAGIDRDGVVPYLRQHENLTRAVREWYPSRKVVYLVGLADTCTDNLLPFCFDSCWKKDAKCFSTNLDTRCPAMLQGPNRAERAKNYMHHLQQFYGYPVHRLFLIPGAGHQAELELLLALQMKLNHEIGSHRLDHVLQG